MKIDKQRFVATIGASSLHKALTGSILPFEKGERPKDLEQFKNQLFEDITSGQYFPSIPRGYIVVDKQHGVARIVPVLSYADSCVYYFCIKELEDEVAVNRVDGTFGGWRLGNSLRKKEADEVKTAEDNWKEEHNYGAWGEPYAPPGSYDPFMWVREWGEFQRLAYLKASAEGVSAFVRIDIANFYDNINLDLLERKLRSSVKFEKSSVVDLLLVLLRNWNRRFEGYAPKTVGLPQDDFGDCSRILANFYLQGYDAHVGEWAGLQKTHYLRYADDQIIMAGNLPTLRDQLSRCSGQLHRIGLNINSSKVQEFEDRDQFYAYWALDTLKLILGKPKPEAIGQALSSFLDRMDQKVERDDWRWYSIFSRILTVGLNEVDETDRSMFVKFALDPKLIARLEFKKLVQLDKMLREPERDQFNATLNDLVSIVTHNSFHYNLLKYYGSGISDRKEDQMRQRLREIELFPE